MTKDRLEMFEVPWDSRDREKFRKGVSQGNGEKQTIESYIDFLEEVRPHQHEILQVKIYQSRFTLES